VSARGAAIGVLTTCVVLVAGAFVADRVAESSAEKQVVAAIEENLDVVGTPTVELGGFPFLTQVLAGSIENVTGQVDGVNLDGINATDVTFDGQDVSTSEPYTVGTATISATLPTASIQQIVADRSDLEITVSVDEDVLTVGGKVLGGMTISAKLVPRVEDGSLLVSVDDVYFGWLAVSVEDLPKWIGNRLTDIEIPVEGLPEGLVLTDAIVVEDGVRITADGTDVVLPTEAPPAG
jgi:hypothetical protein